MQERPPYLRASMILALGLTAMSRGISTERDTYECAVCLTGLDYCPSLSVQHDECDTECGGDYDEPNCEYNTPECPGSALIDCSRKPQE